MTTGAYLEHLILLNWKGMFHQRFELHEALTALEGENGAGKTTVMIAAVVVLLPDPQRLSFRNVGQYLNARHSLEATRAALPDRQVDVDGVETLRAESDAQWQRALQDQAKSRQLLEGTETRRRRFDGLLAVLACLAGGEVQEQGAAEMARLLEAEYRDLEDRVARAEDLPQRIERADRRARRQSAVHGHLREEYMLLQQPPPDAAYLGGAATSDGGRGIARLLGTGTSFAA